MRRAWDVHSPDNLIGTMGRGSAFFLNVSHLILGFVLALFLLHSLSFFLSFLSHQQNSDLSRAHNAGSHSCINNHRAPKVVSMTTQGSLMTLAGQ